MLLVLSRFSSSDQCTQLSSYWFRAAPSSGEPPSAEMICLIQQCLKILAPPLRQRPTKKTE